VLHNHTVELGGTSQITCFACCLTRTEETFSNVPREFDIKPQVTLMRKILLLHYSALGVPMNWYTCLVPSRLLFQAPLPENKESVHNCNFHEQELIS
jgi:hypothetical protein